MDSRIIAIVDDDSSVLKALARRLSVRSFVAKTYRSGFEFLASLHEELPDCLIADLHMPEMTGLELQEALVQRGVNIPTIIITAYDEPMMRLRCESAGAFAYLSKPLKQTPLFAAIEDGCRKSALHRQGRSTIS
jgi:FixJ family two-component response regulator